MLVGSHARFEVGKTFGVGDIGHWDLMRKSIFGRMETGLQVEDGLAVLDSNDASG